MKGGGCERGKFGGVANFGATSRDVSESLPRSYAAGVAGYINYKAVYFNAIKRPSIRAWRDRSLVVGLNSPMLNGAPARGISTQHAVQRNVRT